MKFLDLRCGKKTIENNITFFEPNCRTQTLQEVSTPPPMSYGRHRPNGAPGGSRPHGHGRPVHGGTSAVERLVEVKALGLDGEGVVPWVEVKALGWRSETGRRFFRGNGT